MLTTPLGAIASTTSPTSPSASASIPLSSSPSTSSDAQRQPPPPPEQNFSSNNIRHMLFGTPEAVKKTVHNLHSRGYADPNDWSPAISTGRCNEVMRI